MSRVSKVGFIVVCLLLLCQGTVFAQQINWITRAPLPQVREGASGAVAPGPDGFSKVYVMHGYSGGDSTALRIYDPIADSWSAGPNSPGIASSEGYFGATADDGSGTLNVYIIGGRAGTVLSQNLKFNPITNTWAAGAAMPTPRAGAGITVQDNLIYVIGGRDGITPFSGAPLNANQVYDPVANTWTSLAPLPTPRSGVAAVSVNGLIYVIGGWTLAGGIPTLQNIVEVFDPAMNTWSSAAPMPTARAYLGAAERQGLIYTIGGLIGTAPVPGNMTNVVEVYDPLADSWCADNPMPTPRAELVVLSDGTNLFAMGGGIFGASLAANESSSF